MFTKSTALLVAALAFSVSTISAPVPFGHSNLERRSSSPAIGVRASHDLSIEERQLPRRHLHDHLQRSTIKAVTDDGPDEDDDEEELDKREEIDKRTYGNHGGGKPCKKKKKPKKCKCPEGSGSQGGGGDESGASSLGSPEETGLPETGSTATDSASSSEPTGGTDTNPESDSSDTSTEGVSDLGGESATDTGASPTDGAPSSEESEAPAVKRQQPGRWVRSNQSNLPSKRTSRR